MGFRLGPGEHIQSAARIPWRLFAGLGAVAFGIFLAWITVKAITGSSRRDSAVDLEIDPRPVITSLQELGELHTMKMTMKDVLRKSSEKDAEGWLHSVPGGDNVSRWATHNQVLVVAEGSVEAGIDLSRISAADVVPGRLRDGSQGLRVRLPKAVVYPPNITLRVENTESGLLWRDENLVPKAQVEAAARFKETAEQGHIREQAEEKAVQRLQQFEKDLGIKNIEFYF